MVTNIYRIRIYVVFMKSKVTNNRHGGAPGQTAASVIPQPLTVYHVGVDDWVFVRARNLSFKTLAWKPEYYARRQQPREQPHVSVRRRIRHFRSN